MSKRFTETGKWEKTWFRKLPPRLKCLWFFMCDKCDAGGVLEMDWDLASFQIDEEVSEADLDAFEDRITVLDGGKIYLKTFIEFQYGDLSESCNGHKSAIRAIKKHFTGTLPVSILDASGTLLDKEENKEEDKDKKEEGEKPKAKADWNPSEMQIEAGSWFHRRPTTPWSPKEIKAWKALGEISDDDFELMFERYTSTDPAIAKYLRRDLITLLNNWNGELDKARKDGDYTLFNQPTRKLPTGL